MKERKRKLCYEDIETKEEDNARLNASMVHTDKGSFCRNPRLL